MEKRCIIISGGEQSPIPARQADDFVIACDKGYVYAKSAGITPDLVIGDFDSCTGETDASVPTVRYQAEKDDTDTMLAVRFAAEHGFSHAEICCALGGRLDHAYANIQAAVFAAESGMFVCLSGQSDTVYVLNGSSVTLPRRHGFSLSLFAFSDVCRGVFVTGTKYTLENAVLSRSFPRGVSNEWTAKEAHIRVTDGILLVIVSAL